MLSGLPEAWIGGAESAGAWSPYQVVGHLTHVEEVDWIDRTRVILEHGTDRVFEPVDREAGFTSSGGGRSAPCSAGSPSCGPRTSGPSTDWSGTTTSSGGECTPRSGR